MAAVRKPKAEVVGRQKDRLEGLTYLAPMLPLGWQNFFSLRRAGRYWGLSIVCPQCGASPPAEVDYGSRRWRWLTVHMAKQHTTGRKLRLAK
jgi:hypothetical protein